MEKLKETLKDEVIAAHFGRGLAESDRLDAEKLRNDFSDLEVGRMLRRLDGRVEVDLTLT